METDNIVLEHLRAIRAQLDRMDNNVSELVEQAVSQRMRDIAQDTDLNSHHRRLAHVEAEVERIKKRLDLVE